VQDLLRINQQNVAVACPPELDIPACFGELIRSAADSYGQRVVVLVDEHDKPILDNLTTSALPLSPG
jgi:hypothetical protein